jgi:ferredoxin
MALQIGVDCTLRDACVPACRNDAIAKDAPVYVIDPRRCTECVGAEDERQCQLVCPADCIGPHPGFRESREDLLAKYAALHG